MSIGVEKSTGVSILLTLFFGPLGLLYASKLWGFLMTVIELTILVFVVSGLPDPMSAFLGVFLVCVPFFWFVNLILSVALTTRNNKKVAKAKELAEEARHQETLAALGRAKQ